MNKLKVDLQHCYGIKKLNYEFDFNDRIASIYAPNGAMKTSFAKVFKDISTGGESSDLMFPQRETVRNITDENGNTIEKDNVFVIDPYNEEFNSDKMSTLLVNKELRTRFDEIHLKINKVKDSLLSELKKLSGLKPADIEDEVSLAIKFRRGEFFKALLSLELDVMDKSDALLSDISYKSIYSDKVINFLNTKDFKEKIAEYIKKYDELVDSSRFFKKGVFNHTNATVIAKNLADNGFFEAKHSVTLNSKDSKQEINDQKELEEVIKHEKEAILSNPDLVKAFEEVDKKLTANAELRTFRDYLLQNPKILPLLGSLERLKMDLWISYFKTLKEQYDALLREYKPGEEDLEKIREQAKRESTDWLNVIGIFNKRFTVPFVLEVDNQADVILSNDVPIMKFVFQDMDELASVEKVDLLKALSNGEKRALYILNIIFEVEARKKAGQETVFVIDDIADSFDYKNKYAIIEYLKEISENELFYQIILSHNFDFFRTISSRFVKRKYSYMITKTDVGIEIVNAQALKPFQHFKDKLHQNDYILIASIPFVRNLIEYSRGEDDAVYLKLTALLHIKQNTRTIKKERLEAIFSDALNKRIELSDKQKPVIDLVHELAAQLSQDASTNVNLENKIVLSIAIRLKAEEFMISKISDSQKTDNISKSQTFELFQLYKDMPTSEPEAIKLLEQVNLMTPENIHLNSFMYEPILDMSDDHLKGLYKELQTLT